MEIVPMGPKKSLAFFKGLNASLYQKLNQVAVHTQGLGQRINRSSGLGFRKNPGFGG
jgi:hypothetical protein